MFTEGIGKIANDVHGVFVLKQLNCGHLLHRNTVGRQNPALIILLSPDSATLAQHSSQVVRDYVSQQWISANAIALCAV